MAKAKKKQINELDIQETLIPIIEYEDDHINCQYFDDGSGAIFIMLNGNQIFYADDGRIQHQIKYAEKFMKNLEKQIKQMKRCIPKLKALKKKHKL